MNYQQHRRPSRSRQTLVLALMLLVASLGLGYGSYSLAQTADNREQAIEKALELNGGAGKVLSVRKVQDKQGFTEFAVKILAEGRVRVYRVKKTP